MRNSGSEFAEGSGRKRAPMFQVKFSVRFKRVAFTQVCVAKDRVGGTPAP